MEDSGRAVFLVDRRIPAFRTPQGENTSLARCLGTILRVVSCRLTDRRSYVPQQVLSPHLDTLSEQQRLDIVILTQSCQQAEDALSQGMDKLQFILAEAIAHGLLRQGNYLPQIGAAIDKLENLVRFVNQVQPPSISRHSLFISINS